MRDVMTFTDGQLAVYYGLLDHIRVINGKEAVKMVPVLFNPRHQDFFECCEDFVDEFRGINIFDVFKENMKQLYKKNMFSGRVQEYQGLSQSIVLSEENGVIFEGSYETECGDEYWWEIQPHGAYIGHASAPTNNWKPLTQEVVALANRKNIRRFKTNDGIIYTVELNRSDYSLDSLEAVLSEMKRYT